MKRISDETFKNSNFNYDDIVSIRIENGEFYFLGWMENGERYKIQMLQDYTKGKLDFDDVLCGSIYNAVTTCDGYGQNVFYAWILDGEGFVILEQDPGIRKRICKIPFPL